MIVGYKRMPAMPLQRVIIEPRKEVGEYNVPDIAIMAFVQADMNLFKRRTAKVVRDQKEIAGRILECRMLNGLSLALAGPVLGAPQAVILLEKLIALGARYIICMGWCGSISPSVAIGDLILVQDALSEEGTSPHYPVGNKKVEASGLLMRCLTDALSQRGCSFSQGRIWSTDAIFRETEDKVLSYARKGILAVDMEISALLRVGSFRNVHIAGLLAVSDELGTLKWRPGFHSPALRRARLNAVEVILDACHILAKEIAT
jgi:uridine phosphorylase